MCTLVRAPASTLFPYTTLFRSQHHDTFGPGPEPGVWVEFLEGFFFTVFEWDEADEQHHCCGVLPCGVQCDVRIGCTRTTCHHGDTGRLVEFAVGFGHVGGPAFVTANDVFNGGIGQSVQDVQI